MFRKSLHIWLCCWTLGIAWTSEAQVTVDQLIGVNAQLEDNSLANLKFFRVRLLGQATETPLVKSQFTVDSVLENQAIKGIFSPLANFPSSLASSTILYPSDAKFFDPLGESIEVCKRKVSSKIQENQPNELSDILAKSIAINCFSNQFAKGFDEQFIENENLAFYTLEKLKHVELNLSPPAASHLELLLNPDLSSNISPKETALTVSAIADGHGFSHLFDVDNQSIGLANSNPQLRIILPALDNFRTAQLRKMITWWANFRRIEPQYKFEKGPVLPFLAFNFKHYANKSNPTEENLWENLVSKNSISITQFATPEADARSPEAEKLKEQLQWTMRDITRAAATSGIPVAEYANKEFWLSEFGYDTEQTSLIAPNGVSSYDVPGNNRFERWLYQGQWLVRSFLEISAASYVPEDDDFLLDSVHEPEYSFSRPRYFSAAYVRELKDNENRGTGTGQFQTCGLLATTLDRQFRPKTSWYFIQQLKSVLAGYTFETELEVSYNGNNPFLVEPKAYLYARTDQGSNTRYRIAWWLPGEDLEEGILTDISLKDTRVGATTFSSYVTLNLVAGAYELVDHTELPQYRSYTGDVEIGGGGSTISYDELPISETPRFLDVIELATPVFPTVSKINVTPSCCTGVRVTWSSSGPRNNITYTVYAVPADPNGNAPIFTTSDPGAIQVATNISGNSAFVSGLEENVTYYIFVVPTAQPSGQQPSLGGQNASAYISLPFTATSCNSACFLPVSPGMISGNTAENTAQGIDLLVNTTGGNSSVNACSLVEGNTLPDDGWTSFSGAPPTITIDFGAPHRLDAMYLYDIQGQGTVIIEGKYCDCEDDWTPITSYRTASYLNWAQTGSLGIWTQIRLRKIEGGHLGKVRFCGEPDIVNCQGEVITSETPQVLDFARAAPPAPKLDIYKEGNAQISWPLTLVDSLLPEGGTTRMFEVTVYQNETPLDDAQLVIVPPTAIEGSYRIEGLNPTLAYHANVEAIYLRPDPICERAGTGASGTVIISPLQPSGGNTGGRAQTPSGQLTFGDWAVRPNPARDVFEVVHPTGVVQITITDQSGRIVIVERIDTEATSSQIDTQQLPAGTYAVGVHSNSVVLHKQIVLMK